MRKCQRDVESPKDDPMLNFPVAKSALQHPASPTFSLELIASTGGALKAKKKEKASSGSFWDDVVVAVLKAHERISVEDLSPLGVRSFPELMSPYVHKVMQVRTLNKILFFFFFFCCVLFSHASFFPSQVLGDSLYISGKHFDFEGKLAEAQSKTTSLSTENESLKGQIIALVKEAKKDKDCLTILEKSIDTEKAFLKLKDKQIDEALSEVEKVGIEVVEKFKDSDEYSNKLCDYYMEGFELFKKYLAKCYLELYFSNLDMEAIEREVLSNR